MGIHAHPRFLVRAALLAVFAIAGCANPSGAASLDGSTPAVADAHLELTPPSQGFQVAAEGVVVEPGEDIRWCEVIRLPGLPSDVYHVNRIDTALTAGARDLVVSEARPGSETEALMEPGMRVPCTRAGEAFGEDLVELIATQETHEEQTLPQGVGYVLHGGQKIALDYLYVNPGSEPLAAKIKLNFHTVGANSVTRIASTARFNNLTIYTPPRGRSSHLAECSFSEPVWIAELSRRTQQRGTTFRVWATGGEHDGQLLWDSRNPSEARNELADPLRLESGNGLRFQCDYVNTSDRDLRFGVNASDEMCALGALYWPAIEQVDTAPSQDCLLFAVDADGVARR